MYRSTIYKPGKYLFANAFVAVLMATSFLCPEFPCYAEDPRSEANVRSSRPREITRHSKKETQREDRNDVENVETNVEFILSFSDSVQLTVSETTGGDELVVQALEPLTWDDTQWTIKLGRSIALDGWIELLVVNGQLFVVAASRSDTLEDVSSPVDRRLQDIISVEGEGELVDALPAYEDQDVRVSAVIFVDDLADFPKPVRNPVIRSLSQDIDRTESMDDSAQLVVMQPYDYWEADAVKAAGGIMPESLEAACCTLGGMCVTYGGAGCPGGTTPVTCPCWPRE